MQNTLSPSERRIRVGANMSASHSHGGKERGDTQEKGWEQLSYLGAVSPHTPASVLSGNRARLGAAVWLRRLPAAGVLRISAPSRSPSLALSLPPRLAVAHEGATSPQVSVPQVRASGTRTESGGDEGTKLLPKQTSIKMHLITI